jgi:hypothetical protein
VKARTRTVGSLSHDDMHKLIEVNGYGRGWLWGIQHVAAVGDIPEPWTRLTMRPLHGGGSEATRGLPPGAVVRILPLEESGG